MVEKVLGLWARLEAGWEKAWQIAADLWHEIARTVPPVGRFGNFVVEVFGKYHKDDCLSYAAGLSFWLIVSLVPLSTLLFKLLGAILGGRAFGPGTLKTLQEIVPYLPKEFVYDAVANSQKIGGMGLSWVVLLFGSYWGVSQLDTSLAHVFGLRIKKHRQTRKNHLLRQVIFLVGGVLVAVLFLAILLGGALRNLLPARQTDFLPYLGPLIGLVVMTMVLQHLPRLHVKFRHAFLGAGVSTALWWLAKWGFGVYLRHTLTWGIMYGSLLGIVAGLTFLYYSCAILLLGAEITAAFYRHETGATTVPSWLRVKAGDPPKP
ncbi:YihY/virulence factor BrkB family protein [Geothrix sp. PMB-07]|uniref:YihY/virulence factor BrkB family protein n=1 Tax=Geothrix sp. PMB-07 TaxID=3068640 RepID=UPI0027417FFD|nr:YihY/virulence factor BrkB family protein [Geothrix sp. PMB-07]WLT32385.1 YihY/virulence factor BrkB family protein [Geothrix sp. PMB-07]